MLNQPKSTIKWIDEKSSGTIPLSTEGDPEIDICIKLIRNEQPHPVNTHRRISAKSLKTLMKIPFDLNQVAKIYPSIYHKD